MVCSSIEWLPPLEPFEGFAGFIPQAHLHGMTREIMGKLGLSAWVWCSNHVTILSNTFVVGTMSLVVKALSRWTLGLERP